MVRTSSEGPLAVLVAVIAGFGLGLDVGRCRRRSDRGDRDGAEDGGGAGHLHRI